MFFSFLFPLCADAQKAAKVKSFTLTNDHIPSSDRRKDLNGALCALVKIQVVDNIERIEGNKIGSIVNRGVEKWVYMCKGSRNMKIHLKNHLPVRVLFQNYKINGLQSNRVYEMVIEIPDAPVASVVSVPQQEQPAEAKLQKMVINYSPANAMVLVDSKPYKSNGTLELQLPVGEHSYIVAAEGYTVYEGTIKLNEYAPGIVSANLIPDATVEQKAEETETKKNKKKKKNVLGALSVFKKKSDNKKNKPKAEKKEKAQKSKKQKGSHYAQMKLEEQRRETEQTTAEPQQTVGTESAVLVAPAVPTAYISTSEAMTPPKALSKSFKYSYDGVMFKCKAHKGYVTITGWNEDALNVTVPSQVVYDGNSYPVTDIDTHINGNNYSAKMLTIQEGIKTIEKFAFAEFRSLVVVTIPSSIRSIGKNAFRDNRGMIFHISGGINEQDLRKGNSIKIK